MFEEEGIGLIVLDKNDKFVTLMKAKKLKRTLTPKLRRNEAWLIQKAWNCFESEGFRVEGEVELGNIPKRAKKKIDLTLLPRGMDLSFVAREQDRFDHIGIEVKYNIKSGRQLTGIILKQLNPYADSGCFTKVNLLVHERDSWVADKIGKLSDRKFGVIVFRDTAEIESLLEAPKLTMHLNVENFIYY